MPASETQTAANRFRFLVEAAVWRYRAQGFAVRRAVRRMLLGDPFYRELLAAGRLPREGLLLDLGCGRGALLALLSSEQSVGNGRGGRHTLSLLGIEPDPALAESARQALADKADIVTCELGEAELPACRAALVLDVLFRLEPGQQDRVLERLAAALEEGGLVILREPDAKVFACRAGLALWARTLGWLRRERDLRFYPRSGEEWKARLAALGLRVESLDMGGKKGWPKVLLAARKAN